MRYIKGSFAGITKEHTDIMDNFILATGIRGHKKLGQGVGQWLCVPEAYC